MNRPYLWSLVAHAVVIGGVASYFALFAGAPRPPAPAPPAAAAGAGAGGENRSEPPARELAKTGERLAVAVKAAEGLTPQQRYDAALVHAERLEKISSPESMQEIGGVFRESLQTKNRAYRPADQPPAGPFDAASQLPYAVRRSVGKDGQERRSVVWLDRDGRTKEEELTPRHPLAQNTQMLAVFERLDASPTLRSFRDEILLRALDKMLGDK